MKNNDFFRVYNYTVRNLYIYGVYSKLMYICEFIFKTIHPYCAMLRIRYGTYR